jgi:hypothetical protein
MLINVPHFSILPDLYGTGSRVEFSLKHGLKGCWGGLPLNKHQKLQLIQTPV